jgi:hypothetical protein
MLRSMLIVSGLLCSANYAQAQLAQPRCGGWPPVSGNAGLIVAPRNATCYGTLLAPSQFSFHEALLDVRVKRAPSAGAFRLLNANEFAYTSSNKAGREVIELESTWQRGTQKFTRPLTLHGYTEQEYARLGGTSTTPPAGETVSRPLPPTATWPRF